jgi:hypothetical protein
MPDMKSGTYRPSKKPNGNGGGLESLDIDPIPPFAYK